MGGPILIIETLDPEILNRGVKGNFNIVSSLLITTSLHITTSKSIQHAVPDSWAVTLWKGIHRQHPCASLINSYIQHWSYLLHPSELLVPANRVPHYPNYHRRVPSWCRIWVARSSWERVPAARSRQGIWCGELKKYSKKSGRKVDGANASKALKVNLEVHESKRRKGTSSRKCNCPFRIVVIEDPVTFTAHES